MGFKSNKQLAEEARSHAQQKVVVVGRSYRITDGTYKGRLAKVERVCENARGFAVVNLLDAFGKPTGNMDVLPIKYME